jgi:curved DNA-binding protein CbpA
MSTSYYEVLGLEPVATAIDIKRAYFRLVKQFTPDKNPDEFKKLRTAYDTLSDPSQKAQYDRELAEHVGSSDEASHALHEASEFMQRGRAAKAVDVLKAALSQFPDDRALGKMLTKAYMSAGKTGLAL